MYRCSECDGRAASQPVCLLQTSFRSLPTAAGYGQSGRCQIYAGCEYHCEKQKSRRLSLFYFFWEMMAKFELSDL